MHKIPAFITAAAVVCAIVPSARADSPDDPKEVCAQIHQLNLEFSVTPARPQ